VFIGKSTIDNPITKAQIFIAYDDRGKTAKFKNPMIALGETKVPYKAYVGNIDNITIPEEIRSLDGYGLGINSTYYNYIDFDRKVFVQNVYRMVFKGTEAVTLQSVNANGIANFQYNLNKQAIAHTLLCNQYDIDQNVIANATKSGINLAQWALFVRSDTYSTVEEWKAHLAELYASGNPLIIDYVLATPIETNISTYITDEYIQVEGGGIITAVNEHKLDVPTRMYYLIAN
jgi:hypothetical protein